MLVRYAKQFKVDIAPLLVAEISFTNIASSLTPFGNPQNLLLWQASGISASWFVLGTWLPLAISGGLTAAALYHFRTKEGGAREFTAPILPRLPLVYLIVVGLTIFSLDTLGLTSVLTLGIAFVLGLPFTIRSPRRLLKEFDYRSLLVLYLLVGSIAIVAALAQPVLIPYVGPAAAGKQPYSAFFWSVSFPVEFWWDVVLPTPRIRPIVMGFPAPAPVTVRVPLVPEATVVGGPVFVPITTR